ncbi:MAG: sigma-E factor negative regulatory protein RseA [Alteromonadaceae bacterium]|jgi:sigma-E factor negative regulatory protein RseA
MSESVGINMQDDKKEWLSALVDSQADLKDLDQVIASDDNKDTWQRYHLMGDVMRGDVAPTIDLDLVNKIEAAIADEATIVSLAAHRSFRQKITQSELFRKSSVFIGKSAQFAVAASVALVTVLSVQQYQLSGDENSPLPVLQTTGPVAGTIAPVSLSSDALSGGASTSAAVDKRQVQLDMLRQQQRIKAMLFDHQQQLRLNGEHDEGSDK